MLERTTGLNRYYCPIDEYDKTVLAYDVYGNDELFTYQCRYEVKLNEEGGIYLLAKEEKSIDDCVRRWYTIWGPRSAKELYKRLFETIPTLMPEAVELNHFYCEYFDQDGKNIQLSYDIRDAVKGKIFPTFEEFCAVRCRDKTLESSCNYAHDSYILLDDSARTDGPNELENWVQYVDNLL